MTLSTINWDHESWQEDTKKLYEQYARNFTIHVPRDSGKSVVDVWAKMQLNSAYGYTGVGKSMYFTKSRYYNNLCKEIALPMKPVSKYKFSRAKWYVADIPIFQNDYPKWREMRKWMSEQFGPQDQNPDAWSRWYSDGFVIRFRDESDYVLFMLKWS